MMTRWITVPGCTMSAAAAIVVFAYSGWASPASTYNPRVLGMPYTISAWLLCSTLLAALGTLFAVWCLRHPNSDDLDDD